jgi:poly-beta-1,6-N-acetyl-D-glucosamine synthase
VRKEHLLIISPVFNEASHIETVIGAMAAQTRPPDEWIVVDDGSSDGTLQILERVARDVPFMRVVSAAPADLPEGADRLLQASEARAFNYGLRLGSDFTHVGKLDGDIELPVDYYERLLEKFRSESSLGLAGCVLEEQHGGSWIVRGASDPRHVRGAVKLYTRDCFDAVGGVREMLGWDAIDEVLARMNGYRTWSFGDLKARHHRTAGSAQGHLRGQSRLGCSMYVEGYTATWILARAVKVGASSHPRLLSGFAYAYGYVSAAVRRVPRFEAPGYRRALRSELRARVVAACKSALYPSRPASAAPDVPGSLR